MNIADLISGGVGSTVTSSASKMLNIDEGKAKWVVSAAVPLMIAALNYNAKNKNQGEQIDRALEQHSGGILANLAGALSSRDTTSDGSKIVNHIFGKNTDYVTQNLSQKSGLSAGQIGGLLAMLAPVVMGFLGQQKRNTNTGGVADLVGGLLGGGAQNSGGGGLLGGLIGSVLGGGRQAAPANDGLGMLTQLAGEFFNHQGGNTPKSNVLESLAGLFGR